MQEIPQAATAQLNTALFQAFITAGLSLFTLALHRKIREPWVLCWAVAWGIYALRLASLITFFSTMNIVWFFWFLVATGWAALAVLWSALLFSGKTRGHPAYLLAALVPPLWGWITVGHFADFMVVAIPVAICLAAPTIWTGWVFWRHADRTRSGGARFLAVALFLWGIHHLAYPWFRAGGALGPWSYYADIFFELSVGLGFGLMALWDFSTRLEARTAQLGRLSGLMVRQHENERRRLSRDLHDETAQTLSAVKLEIGMLREGTDETVQPRLDQVLALVDGGIRGIRRLMNDLRPALLDDLGLAPAIHSLANDVRERSHFSVVTRLPETTPRLSPETELALFRAVQEALANVIRHAEATAVEIRLQVSGGKMQLVVQDNGRGITKPVDAQGHLGLAGMRERIGALGGTVDVGTGNGVTVTVEVPLNAEG